MTCCFVVSVAAGTARAITKAAARNQAGSPFLPRAPVQHSQLTAQWMEGKRLFGSSMRYKKRSAAFQKPPPVTSGRSMTVGRAMKNTRHTAFVMKSAAKNLSASARALLA